MSIETSLPMATNKTPTSVKTYKSSTHLGSPSSAHQSTSKNQFSLSKLTDRSNNNLPNINSNSAVLKDQFKINNISYITHYDEIKAVSIFFNQCLNL